MAVKLGTYSKAIEHKTNAFELWCYRRMLRTSWTYHTTKRDVLQKIGGNETWKTQTRKREINTNMGHDLRDWTGLKRYDQNLVKRAAERRNFLNE